MQSLDSNLHYQFYHTTGNIKQIEVQMVNKKANFCDKRSGKNHLVTSPCCGGR